MKGLRVEFIDTDGARLNTADHETKIQHSLNAWLSAHPEADVQDIKFIYNSQAYVKVLVLYKP